MTDTTAPQVVRNYFAQLDAELLGVPLGVARDIRAGIEEELAGLDAATAAQRIEQLGDPAFIAAEARSGADAPPAGRAGGTSSSPLYVVLTALLVALVPAVGWIVGLVMMWMSASWRTWEKVMVTAVPVAIVLALLPVWALTGRGPGIAVVAVAAGFVFAGAWLLVRGLRERELYQRAPVP